MDVLVYGHWGEVGCRNCKGCVRPHGLGLWKGICMGREKFLEEIQWKIGRDNVIKFWEDEWLERGSLKNQFLRVYNFVTRKDVEVGKVFRGRDGRNG